MGVLIALALPFGARTDATKNQSDNTLGAVYAMTNEAASSNVVVYNRAANGLLTPAGCSRARQTQMSDGPSPLPH